MFEITKKDYRDAASEFNWEQDSYMKRCYEEQWANHLATKRFTDSHKNDLCPNCKKELGSGSWIIRNNSIIHGLNCR